MIANIAAFVAAIAVILVLAFGTAVLAGLWFRVFLDVAGL